MEITCLLVQNQQFFLGAQLVTIVSWGEKTVVRGHLDANSIYAGNPCKKIGSVDDFTQKYKELICE